MTDIEDAKAALSALGNPHGARELQSILAHLERDVEDAFAATRSVCRVANDLPTFHTALARLRHSLVPIHESIFEYEDYADALYWSRKVTNAESQIVLTVLRSYKRLFQDLRSSLPQDGNTSKLWLRG